MPLFNALGRLTVRRIGALVSSADARGYNLRARVEGPLQGTPEAWWCDDQRWFPADAPPRRHNRVTPLVDGERYFGALCAAIRQARHYVYVAGWCLTPFMPLERQSRQQLVENQVVAVLAEAAQRVPVRVLLWSGARALFQPDTLSMLDVLADMQRRGKGDLVCRLDYTAITSHCHHQKAVVIDGQVAFVGGLDLTTLMGDRWDTSHHPLREGPNWHDVQVQIQGEAVADVEVNFRQRWGAAVGGPPLPHQEPTVQPAWQTPVQIVRTLHQRTYPFAPDGIQGIRHAYHEVIRRAKRLIYLENQYLWSPYVLDELITLVQHPPSPDFRIVIVLPLHATDGKWDNDRHVKTLRAADRAGRIVSVYTLYTSGPASGRKPFHYRPIYVHAKVGIIDDEWTLIGSANINHRGFETDSELDALIHDKEFARTLRVQLWAEHLAVSEDQVAGLPPSEVVDHLWKGQAAANDQIVAEARGPLSSAVLRYHVGHLPGAWVLETLEALTLEH